MAVFEWLETYPIAQSVKRAFRVAPYEQLALKSDGTPLMQTTAPQLMAKMLDHLQVGVGMSVLEIGTGSGYNAALLSELVGSEGQVMTVEVDPEVAEAAKHRLGSCGYNKVQTIAGDGWYGYPNEAPYDRIIATAKPPRIPKAWVDQLKVGGILAIPLDIRNISNATVIVYFRKEGNNILKSAAVHRGGFIPMSARSGDIVPEPWRSADIVVFLDGGTNPPAAWLYLPTTKLSQVQQRELLGTFLSKATSEPLNDVCEPVFDFWIYVVITGHTDLLLVANTMDGYGLPEGGFGFFDEGLNIAYVEGLSYHPRRLSRNTEVLVFGNSGEGLKRLLAMFNEWCNTGRPGLAEISIVATLAEDKMYEWEDGTTWPEWDFEFIFGTPHQN